MKPAPSEQDHLPGCSLLTFREIAADAGKPTDPDDPWFDQAGIERCVEGCPERARMVERAKEVARERGWLTDEGFVWDRQADDQKQRVPERSSEEDS